MKLSSPKNHFAHDIVLEGDAPVFATSGVKITYSGTAADGHLLTGHMDNRWRIFDFFYTIAKEDAKDKDTVPSCKACFVKWVKMGSPDAPSTQVQL